MLELELDLGVAEDGKWQKQEGRRSTALLAGVTHSFGRAEVRVEYVERRGGVLVGEDCLVVEVDDRRPLSALS